MDLAYALDDYDTVVLLDASPRGDAPGTLYVVEPELDDAQASPDAHGMDPVTVLALARALGGSIPRTLVVGCEPASVMTGDEDEIAAELSDPVQGALDAAVDLVESLLDDLIAPHTTEVRPP
jgi:hydrogenase maturation protease